MTPSPSPRSRVFFGLLALYAALAVAGMASGNPWLDEAAALALISLFLLPGLRRRTLLAWSIWSAAAACLGLLALRGAGHVALDALPVVVNIALCSLFARTLQAGRQPLIARVIAVIEGPERLALPRVAAYARGLTQAWVLLFAAQATLLVVLIGCAVPDGLLRAFGVQPPFEVSGEWRWYLHAGSYAVVFAFLGIEYAFRRWYLRHIPHASLPVFIGQLVRRWPALARNLVDDDVRTPA